MQLDIKFAYSSILFASVGVDPPCPGKSIDKTLLKILGFGELNLPLYDPFQHQE